MNLPYDITATIGSPGASVVKKLLDPADNAVLNQYNDTTIVDVNIFVPTTDFYLTSLLVTATAACKVEFGVVDDDDSFFPLYPTYATYQPGGGFIREFDAGSAKFRYPGDGTFFPAVRITGVDAGDISIAGDLGISTTNG